MLGLKTSLLRRLWNAYSGDREYFSIGLKYLINLGLPKVRCKASTDKQTAFVHFLTNCCGPSQFHASCVIVRSYRKTGRTCAPYSA